MDNWLKAFVLRLAKVPPDPHVPEGLPQSVQVFHPGRNYLRWCILVWAAGNALSIVPLLAFFAAGTFIPDMPPIVRAIWMTIAWIALVGFVVTLPLTFFAQILNYEMRWYIVTDRSLRIRSGIVRVQEMTMTFANIQEIRVNANPLQRLLGLADLEVHSAGGGSAKSAHGGTSSSGHLGKFEGLDNASEIRDLMVDRLRKYRDSGLGEVERDDPGDALKEAHRVLEEIRALGPVLADLRR